MKRRAILSFVLLAGCTVSAEPTCEAFVDAWAEYELRCGSFLVPAEDRPVEDRDRDGVETDFFGSDDGCEATTPADFRDPRALREECPDELADWPCDSLGLPPSCTDQIRRPPPL